MIACWSWCAFCCLLKSIFDMYRSLRQDSSPRITVLSPICLLTLSKRLLKAFSSTSDRSMKSLRGSRSVSSLKSQRTACWHKWQIHPNFPLWSSSWSIIRKLLKRKIKSNYRLLLASLVRRQVASTKSLGCKDHWLQTKAICQSLIYQAQLMSN